MESKVVIPINQGEIVAPDDRRRITEILARMTKALGVDAAAFALLSDDKVVYPAVYKFPSELMKLSVSKDVGLAGKVIRTGKPVIVENYQTFPERISTFGVGESINIIAVPVFVKGQSVGGVAAISYNPERKLTADDIPPIQEAASKIAKLLADKGQ